MRPYRHGAGYPAENMAAAGLHVLSAVTNYEITDCDCAAQVHSDEHYGIKLAINHSA